MQYIVQLYMITHTAVLYLDGRSLPSPVSAGIYSPEQVLAKLIPINVRNTVSLANSFMTC